MLREGWNFHGDIAIGLESIARRTFGDIDRPFDKIYDADAIEHGSFAECMIVLARAKTNYSNELQNVDNFVKAAGDYIGIPGSAIDKEQAQKLFDDFKSVVGE